ncbi:MAG: hypothetical protein AAGJ28_00370 [Pseudomonadota bacterium]
MTDQKKEPVARHADGRLQTAVWENPGQHGPIYNTTITYSYQDKDGTWKDTTSIPSQELLKVARLADKAYGTIRDLKDRDRSQYVERQQQAADRGPAQERPRDR